VPQKSLASRLAVDARSRRVLNPIQLFRNSATARAAASTVTVTDGEGGRYSLDVQADSSFDAAHLYLTHVKAKPNCGLPVPTTATTFEVITDGKIFHVPGAPEAMD
jgi:hypothetical protein